jgi:hypothetical protein
MREPRFVASSHTSEVVVYDLKMDHRHYSEFLFADEAVIPATLRLLDGNHMSDVGLTRLRVDKADSGFHDRDRNDRPFGDFSYLLGGCGVFSRRAQIAFGSLLADFGEFIPLETEEGEYFFYNCTRYVDALDHKNGKYKYALDRRQVLGVERWWFLPEPLVDIPVFHPVGVRGALLVTEPFVRRARDAQLTGFDFQRLWSSSDPLPKPRRLP